MKDRIQNLRSLQAGKRNLIAMSKDRDKSAQSSDPSANSETKGPKLPKIISFEELARCGNEIWIENNGELYRLQKTKNGKLILTK